VSTANARSNRSESRDEDVVATVLFRVVSTTMSSHAPITGKVRADTLGASRVHCAVVEREVGRHKVRIVRRANRQFGSERICRYPKQKANRLL
jgi:hypothetical protein